MVKRKRLATPSTADLSRIEQEFRSETTGRPSIGRGIAPIAQIAADTATQVQPETAEVRIERARLEADSAQLRKAQEQGLLMLELPVEQIDESVMVRDRMAVDEEEMQELRLSIAANGLRLPIEVFELEHPDEDGPRYGLLSGYRRLLAVRSLLTLTEAEKYSHIRALVRPRSQADTAFVLMVEENEVRENLSHFERGRIAVIAANQGAFSSTDDAVDKLFATGSKAKRSKVRSFALIFEELGDMLKFPEALTERRGLRLATALRRGAEDAIRRVLSERLPANAEEEWASMEPEIHLVEQGPRDRSRGGRPRVQATTPQWKDVVQTSAGVNIHSRVDEKGFTLRFEGPNVTTELLESVVAEIVALLET